MCVFLGEYCGTIAKHEKYTSQRVLMWMLITVIYFEVSVNEPFKINKLIRHLKRKSGCVDDHNADQCSQTLFFFSMEEPSVRIFFTSGRNPTYEKVDSREPFCCLQWGRSVKICNRHRHNMAEYNLKYILTKTKWRDSWQHMEITPVLPFARQIFLPHISRYLEFFTVLQYFYLFLPQFPAEPPTMFCRTLVGKHRCSF